MPWKPNSALEEYDAADIADALTNIREEVAKLPQAHTETLGHLQNPARTPPWRLRSTRSTWPPRTAAIKFYEKLTAFAKLLKLALSSVEFVDKTPEWKIDTYKT